MPQPAPVVPDPVIIIHSLGHAVAALKAAAAAGRRVTLASAPHAGGYAGGGWFRGLVDAAREAVPEARFSALLDCGDEPGSVLAALRSQVEGVIFTGREDVARRLADIARQRGARLETARPIAILDLATDFFAAEAILVARSTEALARAVAPQQGIQATRS
jgi:acyl-CoA reductase-like NAD-dependent aldehyde dehydrogenase